MKRKALSCILALTMCVALLVSGCGAHQDRAYSEGSRGERR